MTDNLSEKARDGQWQELVERHFARAQAAEAQVEALRKALEPFAEAARKAEISGYPPVNFVGAVEFEAALAVLSAPAEEHRTVLMGRALEAALAEESETPAERFKRLADARLASMSVEEIRAYLKTLVPDDAWEDAPAREEESSAKGGEP